MKKIICSILLFALVFGTCLTAVPVSGADESGEKMTPLLVEKLKTLSRGDEISVYLWLQDIDYDEVEAEVKEKTKVCYNDMQTLSDSIYQTYCDSKKITMEDLKSGKNKTDIEEWKKITESVRKDVDESVTKYIETKREISSKKQSEKNAQILKSLKIEKDNRIFESKYSPMNIVKVKVSELYEIIKSEEVVYADLYQELEAKDDSYNYTTLMNYHKAAMNKPTYASYDGSGVKIGQIETGIPNKNNSYEFSNSTIVRLNTSDPIEDHASRVASIMVGREGFSPDAALYVIACGNDTYSAIESLISQGVNVINASYGYDREGDYYSTMERWFDHISFAHNISIIKSAGNIENGEINSPGLAYNIITVGNFEAVNQSGNSYIPATYYYLHSSSYVNSTGCEKPDVVASGCFFPYYNSSGVLQTPKWGTSFSAPVVTSISACLMEQNPTLKTNPVLLKAILMASCKSSTEDETWGSLNDKQGAGILNWNSAYNIVGNSMFTTVSTLSNYFQIPMQSTFGTNKKAIAFTWEKQNIIGTNHNNGSLSYQFPMINYNLSVYNAATCTLIKSSNKANSSAEFTGFTNNATSLYAQISTSNSIAIPVRYALAWNF